MRALKLSQIVEIANRKFPFNNSEPWDNSGIQIGDPNREITNIAFSLDVNPSTIHFAKNNLCELIITHHPLLINPVKNILASELTGESIMLAIGSHVDVLSLHTNLDAAEGGLNDYLAELLGLQETVIPEQAGCARIGRLKQPLSFTSLNELVKRKWNLDGTTVICDDPEKMVSNVFLASGSGSGYLGRAVAMDADVMITGDVKYHSAMDARRFCMPIIDAGHFGMEKHAIKLMADTFREEFEKVGVRIVCCECHDEKDPFNVC